MKLLSDKPTIMKLLSDKSRILNSSGHIPTAVFPSGESPSPGESASPGEASVYWLFTSCAVHIIATREIIDLMKNNVKNTDFQVL